MKLIKASDTEVIDCKSDRSCEAAPFDGYSTDLNRPAIDRKRVGFQSLAIGASRRSSGGGLMKKIIAAAALSGALLFGSTTSAWALDCSGGSIPANGYDGSTLGFDICIGTGWSSSWSDWWRVAYNYWF